MQKRRIISASQLTKVNEEGLHSALCYCSAELMEATEPVIYVTSIWGTENIDSTSVQIKVLSDYVNADIKTANDYAVLELKQSVALLEKKVSDAFCSRIPRSIPEYNQNLVKTGMVLTAIDDEGHCAMVYPFVDNVTKVNGKGSVMKEVVIDASDILLYGEEANVDALIKTLRATCKNQSELISVMSKTIKELNQRLARVEKALVNFTTNQ
jgi:hypothetical protein